MVENAEVNLKIITGKADKIRLLLEHVSKNIDDFF
jgi:hypothetical protein